MLIETPVNPGVTSPETTVTPTTPSPTQGPASSVPTEASGLQATTPQSPESIPYTRFQEVNTKYRETEAMNLQLQQALLQLQQRVNTPQPPTSQSPAFSPEAFWQKAQDDPQGWQKDIIEAAKKEVRNDVVQDATRQALEAITFENQRQSYVKQAESQVVQQFPQLNSPAAIQKLHLYAQHLDTVLPQNVPINEVYDMAARDLVQLVTDVSGRFTRPETPPFVEGNGNLVPANANTLDGKLAAAKAAGDVTTLMNLKLERLATLR